jgi:hypothetical protein
MTASNGSAVLVNLDQVRHIQPAASHDGSVLRLADGDVLNVRDDFNALALRVQVPVPPRPRSEFETAEAADRRQIAMPFAVALNGAVR